MECYRMGTRIVAGIAIAVSSLVVILFSIYLGYLLPVVDFQLKSPDEQTQRTNERTQRESTVLLVAIIIVVALLEILAAVMLIQATKSGKQTKSALSLSKYWVIVNGIWVWILFGSIILNGSATPKGDLEYNYCAAFVMLGIIIVRFFAFYIVARFIVNLESSTTHVTVDIQLCDI